jgi:hypothetical protein
MGDPSSIVVVVAVAAAAAKVFVAPEIFAAGRNILGVPGKKRTRGF